MYKILIFLINYLFYVKNLSLSYILVLSAWYNIIIIEFKRNNFRTTLVKLKKYQNIFLKGLYVYAQIKITALDNIFTL